MPTVLITGAAGFCARHLARRLAEEGGMRLVGLDLAPHPPAALLLDDYLAVDMTDARRVADAVRQVRPDLVFHLAGLARGSPAEIYGVNLLGGIHLLEAIRESRPAAGVLLVGSAAEYGQVAASALPITEAATCRPQDAYGLSKYALTLAGVNYARNLGLRVVIARPFNIVGAGIPPSLVVGAVLQRAKQALAEQPAPVVTIGNVHTQRDFLAVEDVVDAYVRLMRSGSWGEVFNICSGQPQSIRSVVERLLSWSPVPIRIEVDAALVRAGDVASVYGSWEKAHGAFGFRPTTPLDEALRSAWNEAIHG